VNVRDVNDSPPVMNEKEINAGISVEDAATFRIEVTATDADLPETNTFVFSIDGDFETSDDSVGLDTDNPPFQIDESSGIIEALFTPTEGMSGYYQFTVKLEDSEDPDEANSDTSLVKVVIITALDQVMLKFDNPTSVIDAQINNVN